MANSTAGPLDGYRVLAIENYLAGNYGSMLLAYFGAEVIKIEVPGVGDTLRTNGPYVDTPAGRRSHGELRLMAGKKSVELDLSSADGFATFLRMVEGSDVLWSNLKPDSLARIGITNETLERANPDLVFTTITGFGHSDVLAAGPATGLPAFDVIAQGMAGLQFRTPSADGRPVYNGLPLGDQVTSVFAAMGTVLALLDRARSKGYRRVDVAMLDSMLCLNEKALALLSLMNQKPVRGASPTSAPYGGFKTADGWVNIAVGGDPVWKRFCAAIERPELAEDPRFAGNAERVAAAAEVRTITEAWTAQRARDDVMKRLSQYGVPSGPLFDVDELLEEPQAEARGMWLPLNFGPTAGDAAADQRPMRIVGNPIKLSRYEPNSLPAPHGLGDDTDEVLSRFGVPASDEGKEGRGDVRRAARVGVASDRLVDPLAE